MKGKIVNILPWVFMLVAIVLLATFLNKDVDQTGYKELLKAKDEMIQSIIKEREAERRSHELTIMELHRKDSLLQLKYKTIIINNEKIPVYVSGLSDSALRSAVENFR